MTLRTIKAAEGRRVRHPGGRLLHPDGEPVAWSSYWERLHQAGDVVDAPKAPAAPAKSKEGDA